MKAAAKATRAKISRALRTLKPSFSKSSTTTQPTAATAARAIHCAVLRAGSMDGVGGLVVRSSGRQIVVVAAGVAVGRATPDLRSTSAP